MDIFYMLAPRTKNYDSIIIANVLLHCILFESALEQRALVP